MSLLLVSLSYISSRADFQAWIVRIAKPLAPFVPFVEKDKDGDENGKKRKDVKTIEKMEKKRVDKYADQQRTYAAAVDVTWLSRKVQMPADAESAESPQISHCMEIPVLRLNDEIIKQIGMDLLTSKSDGDECAKEEDCAEIARKMCPDELLAYEAQCVQCIYTHHHQVL